MGHRENKACGGLWQRPQAYCAGFVLLWASGVWAQQAPVAADDKKALLNPAVGRAPDKEPDKGVNPAQNPAANVPSNASATAPTTAPANPNQGVLQQWQQQSGQQAQIVPDANGGTRIEWKGKATYDLYHTEVTSGTPTPGVATPMSSGTFNKGVLQSDLRRVTGAGDVAYAQSTFTFTDDHTVLSQHPYQLTNFQVGVAGTGYALQLGDVAANFSSLGSTLGLRGILGSRQFGALNGAGYAGVVADSWEALANLTPRNDTAARSRYLRSVWGTKAEYDLTPQVKVFTTYQGFQDQSSSLPDGASQIAPAATQAVTMGFKRQTSESYLAGEFGVNRFKEDGRQDFIDRAWILDGTYKLGDAANFRYGWHEIGSHYVALAQASAPGVKEQYLGTDWRVASWLTWGIEGRHTKTNIAATDLSAASSTVNDNLTNRFSLTFGSYAPGLSFSVSDTWGRMRDAQDALSYTHQTQASLGYVYQAWNANLSGSYQSQQSQLTPTNDNHTRQAQLSLGRTFTIAEPFVSPSGKTHAGKTVQARANVVASKQDFANGQQTTTGSVGLTVNAALDEWGQWDLDVSRQRMGPVTGPALFTTSFTLTAGRPLVDGLRLNAYFSYVLRNQGDPAQRTVEKRIGSQLAYTW